MPFSQNKNIGYHLDKIAFFSRKVGKEDGIKGMTGEAEVKKNRHKNLCLLVKNITAV